MKAASGEMPRYKLVCQATVGESNGQSMRVASRCLWDKDFDSCAETTWTNVRAPLAAPLFRHAVPPHSPRAAALCGATYAEPRQLSPSRRLPARTEQGVRRCDVLCVVLRVSERAGPPRRSLAPGRRRINRCASSAELCGALLCSHAPLRPPPRVGCWCAAAQDCASVPVSPTA